MIARRGHPTTILGDCARAFKAASRELKNPNWSQIEEDTSKYRTTWIFSTEKAPWHNAIAERMIQSVKESLHKVIGKSSLLRIQLETLLIETEGIVYSRPLGSLSDLANLTCLTGTNSGDNCYINFGKHGLMPIC